MAVEYSKGGVNISPDERTKLIPEDQKRRTKSEFFSDYDPHDYIVFLAGFTILLFLPLGLLAVAIALQAHRDNKMGNYREAKRRKRLVYLIFCLAILADCLIVGFIIIITR